MTKGDIYHELNKSTDRNNIVVNKSPLLNKKKYNKTSLTNFYLPKSNVNVTKPSFESFKAYVRNQKLSNLKKYFKGHNNIYIDINNKYRNNSLYFSSQCNFNKNERSNKITNTDNLSEKNVNSSFFSKSKSPRKKLNREEKIELLKKINKVSRDKSKKTQENLKGEEDSKSASFNTKKNISNDISFSEIISYDNDKKLKNEKEIKAKLNNKIKNEIRKEMKKAKEEIKKELINKMILSSNRNVKKNIPNLKIPINNITNINETSYDFDIINNTYTNPFIDGKYIDLKTNRSISSIDIFFPPNKRISNDIIPGITNYNQMNNKYNNKDNYIVKKFVKLNGVINKRDKNNKAILSNTSINRQKTNIYYKIPILNNRINSFKKNDILKKNDCFKDKNIKQRNNKIIKIGNNNDNQNIFNYKSNSPKRINIGTHLPFRKIIVKNNIQNTIKNDKIPCDRIIKIPKKIINYLDNNSIIINNKTNNIVYVKQISPNRNDNYFGKNIY